MNSLLIHSETSREISLNCSFLDGGLSSLVTQPDRVGFTQAGERALLSRADSLCFVRDVVHPAMSVKVCWSWRLFIFTYTTYGLRVLI